MTLKGPDSNYMHRTFYHIILPALMPAFFIVIAATPVEVFGCRTRGIIAVLIAFCSGVGAMGTVIIALKKRIKGETHSHWWIFTTLVLTVPVLFLLILA